MPPCYCVPRTIDATGVTDITSALQSWVDSIPDGASPASPNVLAFDSTATYLLQTKLSLMDRENLLLEGNGCSFIRTFNPFCASTILFTLSTATAVGTTATFTATASMQPMDIYQQVKVTGCTPAAYNGTWDVIEVVSDTTVKVVLATDPGGPATIVGNIERQRKENHFIVVGTNTINGSDWSKNITLRNMTLNGPNNVVGDHVVWNQNYEFQHGIVMQGVENMTIDNVTVREQHGDGIFNQGRNVGGGVFTPSSGLVIKNSTTYWVGRQGWTMYGLNGVNYMSKNSIDETGRAIIDHEPPGDAHGQVAMTCEDLTIPGYFGGTGAVINATGKGATGWGPIVYRRVSVGGGNADFFFHGRNEGEFTGYRRNLTIEDCSFIGLGAAANNGTWAAVTLLPSTTGNGWQYVLVKNSTFEFTQGVQDEGGVKLQNCDNVTVTGCTFTNVYNYGGSPTWYGDAGGNTNINVS